MYTIKLNKKTKNLTLKAVQRSVKLIQKVSNIQLKQTGRAGPQGPQGIQGIQGEQGPPGSDATDKNFVQNFTNASVVTATHNLSKYPAVSITDSAGDEVVGQIEYLSINQIRASFSNSFTGKIVCN